MAGEGAGGQPAPSASSGRPAATPAAARGEAFAYACNRCSRCCWHKVIQVNPYEIARLARRVGLSTGDFTARYTEDGTGAQLTRREDGSCSFLGPEGCGVHPDRPLVCRIYPLGRHVAPDGSERWSHLAPHPQTAGVYGADGTIGDYIAAQGALPYMQATDDYTAWLRRAYDVVAEAADAAEDGPSAADMLDMDSVIAAHCSGRGVEEPLDIEARKALHLAILAEWLDQLEGGA
ncbi:MAG TPA: YkgJ family cysteine cluster protein [Caulobacteraceae bacterium]